VTRAAWLESRRRGLGGSDVGQIPSIVRACGGDPAVDCSPWGSEWHVWASKIEEGPPSERSDSEEMAVGRWLERPILEWAAEQLGGELQVGAAVTVHYGALVGSLDGVATVAGKPHGLEAKVSAGWEPWESVPFYYRLQCATYMALTDLDCWHVAAFFRQAGVRRLYQLPREQWLENALRESAAAWWQRHIVEGHHPEVDASADCARGLAHLHPRTAGASFAGFRIATDDEIRLARQIRQLQGVADDIADDIAISLNHLRASIGDAPGIRWTGGSARWSANGNLKLKMETP
jgi:predicted phage-related endonuclease